MPKIHDEEFEQYLYDCVTIDEDRINEEYCRVAADLAYWGRRHANAEEAYLAAKANVKREAASAWIRTREKLEEEESERAAAQERKFKPPAVALIDKHTELDEGLAMARATFASAARMREETSSIVSAVHTKREMLVSLGATLRKELEMDPSIRSPADDEEDLNWDDDEDDS